MDPLTLTATVIGLIIAGFGSWYTYLSYKRAHTPALDTARNDEQRPVSLLARLLPLLWDYPEHGGNHLSWAVKESFVLRGRLEDAREEPGLGVAIVTTELAQSVFGDEANSRIDGCVTWALAQSFEKPPYLLKGKKSDSRTSEEIVVPDFRHSLAFAIILARSRKLRDRVSGYLNYALDRQNADGGWPAGEGRTISEVFTVLYGIEFLSLCGLDERLSDEMRSRVRACRNRASHWLVSNVPESGLWKSGVLPEYAWDDVVTSAWILHRLVPLKGITTPHWNRTLSHAALCMVSKVGKQATWSGSSELQHFRVEARVAASLARTLASGFPNSIDGESIQIYMSDWRRRAHANAPRISEVDWDVGTGAFILQAMFSTRELQEWIEKEGPTNKVRFCEGRTTI